MITYLPGELLKKISPKKKLRRLLTQQLSVNRAVLSMFDDIDFIKKKNILEIALNTAKQYKNRYKESEEPKSTITDQIKDRKLLINRVQNAVVQEVAKEIKDTYDGEYYIWLPSDAETPDPEHQLNYGKKFQIGVGEMPGDRYGCKCGMEILVEGSKLEL